MRSAGPELSTFTTSVAPPRWVGDGEGTGVGERVQHPPALGHDATTPRLSRWSR